jgi:hypothetical protein
MQDKFDQQRTRYGGVRRSTGGSSDAQSGPQMKGASVARNHPSGLVFRWREQLGLPGCPYVIRWRFETKWFSIRLHHWLAPDDDRAHHDHPWNFITFVIKGGYWDVSPAGNEHLHAPVIRYRNANHRHTVRPCGAGAWTIVMTGSRVRTWGFWADGVKFIKANKWFASRGHHPCD